MKTICSNCQAENDASSKYCSVCGFKLPLNENENVVAEVENKKADKPEKKFNLKTSIGFIVGFVVVFFITQSLFKPSIDSQLVDAANELNKNCPMNVDENTTLKNAVALPNKTFQYNYVLVGISKEEVKIDTVKKYIFPRILEDVKKNPQLKSFRDNKVTIKYNYTDFKGEFVTEYVVTPEMYE